MQPERLTFALISETPHVRGRDLVDMWSPIEANARAGALAWGLLPPAIEPIDKVEHLPLGCHQVVVVDKGGDPGVLAMHYPGPTARAWLSNTSGLYSGKYSLLEALCHEVLEALVNPQLRRWLQHPDLMRAAQGVQVAAEVGDPLQTTYECRDEQGKSWNVANFALPSWFGLVVPNAPHDSKRFDYAGELSRPGEIGPEGYCILRAPDPDRPGAYTTWFETAADGGSRIVDVHQLAALLPEHKREALLHPLSRTAQLAQGGVAMRLLSAVVFGPPLLVFWHVVLPAIERRCGP